MKSVPIILRVKGLAQAHNIVRRLTAGGLRKINKRACRSIANEIRKAVKERYLIEGGHSPHARGTQQVYRQGKAGYPGPNSWNRAKRRYIAARPYYRTGELATSVVSNSIKGGYRVQINPKKSYRGDGERGTPLWYIAAKLEYPRPAVIRLSHRMLGYLQVLERGTGGQKKRSRARLSGAKMGQSVIIRPKERKVWRWVTEQLGRYRDPYWRLINNHVRLVITEELSRGDAGDLAIGMFTRGIPFLTDTMPSSSSGAAPSAAGNDNSTVSIKKP